MSSNKWHDNFFPCYTPKEMLELGVFEGKYLNDDKGKYPKDWFTNAKVVDLDSSPDVSLNMYQIKSRKSLKEWQDKGWVLEDPKGWFEWYCNYFLGRRIDDDATQIRRWNSFVARHMGQINANCELHDDSCRPKQRQGLLQWAWDSTKKYNDPKVKKNNLAKMKRESAKYNK